MKKQMSILGLFFAGLITISACAEYDYFNRILERSSKNTPQDKTETPTDVPDGANDPTLDYFTVTGTWNQPDNTGAIAKPEVVFVVDTSGSMGNEVTAIKNSIIGWINQLESQNVYDFCLGVVRAHVSSSHAGKLVAASGNNKCICTFGDDAVSPGAAADQFRDNMDAALNASGGGSVETPIYSANVSINDADILESNQSDGCFRDDATLVFGLVSDENDSGYAQNAGSNEFENEFFLGQGNEYTGSRGDPLYPGPNQSDEATIRKDYYTDGTLNGNGKYENNLTALTLISDVQDYNGDLPTFGFSIGYKPDNLPSSGQGDPFWGGMQFADQFGQDLVDLKDSVDGNDAAFQASMNAMADALVQQISFYDSFTLGDTICDVDGDDDFTDEEVEIKVGGSVVNASNYSINATGTKIIFNQDYDWSAGAAVSISYITCE